MTNSPMRFGLIGAGRWGKIYIRTLNQANIPLASLYTSRPENAALVASTVNIFSDWKELLQSDCDAIIIATPPKTHAEILEACIHYKKPCIVEKPFCLDLPTAKYLNEKIYQEKLPVLVNFTHLFSPAYQRLKKLLTQETVRMIVSEGQALGPHRLDSPVLWDWCSHDFSLCLDLLNQYPDQVKIMGAGINNIFQSPEMLSIRLDFTNQSNDCTAWINAGVLSWQKRRGFSVFTNTHLYTIDDTAPAAEKLTVAQIDFDNRYADGFSLIHEKKTIDLPSHQSSLTCAIDYFQKSFQGGNKDYMGAGFALKVTELLTQCEMLLC